MKKKYGKIIHIYDPIFKINFYAVKGGSFKKFAEIMKKQLKIDLGEEKVDGKFIVITNGGIDIGLIWGKRKGELIHECLHATVWALESKGINMSKETDEVYAYYQQFLLNGLDGKGEK